MNNSRGSDKKQFRILYRQFLLRVVDLEMLSAKGDTLRLFAQLASILVMISIIHGIGLLLLCDSKMPPAAQVIIARLMEYRLIATNMLVVGLFAVLSWESIFPDRRDVMVLAPLPVRVRTLFLGKIAAAGASLGLCVLALNFASGLIGPLFFRLPGWLGFPRAIAAYWITMLASGAFLFSTILAIQGMAAQLLPRRLYLRFSAILQIAAFCLFLSVYFLAPQIATPRELAAPNNQRLLALLPTYWFLGLFNWLNGSMHPALAPLLRRAGIGIAVVLPGAGMALLGSYLRTIRKIVEEPDIVPATHGKHWQLYFGNSLHTAIVSFALRSLLRSRQHRLTIAFYLGVGFTLALGCLSIPGAQQGSKLVSLRFLISTTVMMVFAITGVRVAFAMPISLPANWSFRITQTHAAPQYFSAARWALLTLAVFPVWISSALLSLPFEPWQHVLAHLAVLGLLGVLLADLSLLTFPKIPLACSYLPGKANVQFLFWTGVILLIPLVNLAVYLEQRAIAHPIQYTRMLLALCAIEICIWWWGVEQGKSANLLFEEEPPVAIMTLGLHQERL
jgi:hypothetical protein